MGKGDDDMAIASENLNKTQSEAFSAIRKIMQEQMKKKGYKYNPSTQTLEKR